jgi:transposase, IS5 family
MPLQYLSGAPQPKTVLVDLGFRGVDAQVSSVQLIHRGKHKTLTNTQRRWFKRRQAIEPIIGRLKQDRGMQRGWLKGTSAMRYACCMLLATTCADYCAQSSA